MDNRTSFFRPFFPTALLLLTAWCAAFGGAARGDEWRQDFAAPAAPAALTGAGFSPWSSSTTARVEDGALRLLSGAKDESNGVLFESVVKRSAWIEAAFEMRLGGADGAGLVFLDAAQVLNSDQRLRLFGSWDEPNVARGFGVGFDTLNPPETNAFNANGNIYNHPEREISLHWNAIERLNRRSETEFRTQSRTAAFVPVRVRLQWVTGGAQISLWVQGAAVYDAVFVPDVTPMDFRVALGAKSSKQGAFCDVRGFRLSSGPPMPAPPKALTVAAVEREPITITRALIKETADFPRDNRRFGRILARLSLQDVSPAIDAWDRLGSVRLVDERGEKFELIRFITPYRRAADWTVDVSDFRPLLTGKKRLEIECETYSEGWTVNLSFDFCPGPAPRYATRVVNLWNGEVEIGNPQKPVAEFWKPRAVQRPRDADAMEIRILATGHGMNPNSKNAAEFMPLERTLTVGRAIFNNTLWKTDNYLNPLRPQSGTWKYNRAGWAPGNVVDPWQTDVSAVVPRGQSVTIDYAIAPYLNENAGKGNPPFYAFASTAIFYRKAS